MIRSTLAVRAKDLEEMIQLARKYKAFPKELTMISRQMSSKISWKPSLS
jgi:hypothetical protein